MVVSRKNMDILRENGFEVTLRIRIRIRIIYYCKKNFNNKWLNKIVKLTFEVFGQSK